MLNTVLEQNYIQFNNQYYKQNDCLAMGVHASAILAEVFIQYIENTRIIKILKE
jgi:coproporphyrinogen III oxidase-like Fe-S oxidoreductase